ncbi:hypothetical protein A1O3_08117 [Capronia epimyces CBS 606.96]|uniref:Carboxylic ester hydrolase n=1 Tax=Capronia epimyces CBS 606.96 TaxID=1182542 RepID=W9XH67_9EURO|nr:uncharacterized protein A1O3_08117 [Capronia epimyces CBS 606.96]EXJ79832.1 hypothetical protein A1O3_08117 [Capronia epimyces CBS 606.96]
MPAATETNGVFTPGLNRGKVVLSLQNYASDCALQIADLTLHGYVSTHGVANFLNIPYAQIPARFKTARLLSPCSTKGHLDATQYGPRCPQPFDPIHDLMKHMFEQLSMSQYSSEFECLHLNIYAPPEALQNQHARKFPVFAYIHGGAFNCGDDTTEFDGNHLVKRSMELGQPAIVVVLNYRLNILGFLSSRELVAEAEEAGEMPVINQGLNDQKIALQWIRQNIGYFGGDASRVTLSGESAGAASVLYQLKGKQPLFSQAIICSSPRPSFRPFSQAQALFDRLVEAAGVNEKAPYQVKLQALRSYSAQDLIGLIPDMPLSTAIEDANWFVDWDPHRVRSLEYWADMPTWCSRIIVGHTKDEASLFLTPNYGTDLSETDVRRHLQSIDPDPKFASAILSSEPMKSASSPLRGLVALATQAVFVAPILEFASAASCAARSPGKIYCYSIDVTDPFPGEALDGHSPGPLSGYAWHSFGNAILFYQPACQTHAELAITADKMSEAYIKFMAGGEMGAWESFGLGGRKMSWNGSHTGLVDVGLDWRDAVAETLAREGGPAWVEAYRANGLRSIHPLPELCARSHGEVNGNGNGNGSVEQ